MLYYADALTEIAFVVPSPVESLSKSIFWHGSVLGSICIFSIIVLEEILKLSKALSSS